MVIFENAGHGIYDEATDKSFAVLKDFIHHLPQCSLISWILTKLARVSVAINRCG